MIEGERILGVVEMMELARNHRHQSAVRKALDAARGSGLMDAATGLFTRDLFAAHLARLAYASKQRNRALSVCVPTRFPA